MVISPRMTKPSTRRVVTALAGRDQLKAGEEFLQANAGQEVLIVSATRTAADELARSFCVKTGGDLGIHRFSTGPLAVEIASQQLALTGKSILAGVAVDALAARAVQECRANSALQW